MSQAEPPTISAEQERWLRQGALIARALSEQKDAEKAEPPKPWWQRFLESAGGTALITVVIGGIFGAVISGIFQLGATEREFQQSWLRARGDQAMVAYKDFVEKRTLVVERIYQRIERTVAASEDLIALSKPDFTPLAGLDEATKKEIQAYRKPIMDQFELRNAEWRNEKDSLGFLIDYYHPQEKAVVNSWTGLKQSISGYLDCASAWHKDHPSYAETSKACIAERGNLMASVENFNSALGSSRTYVWQGWESPEELRKALNK